jgi:cell division protein FtsW
MLDKLRSLDRGILFLTIVLVIFGIMMLISATGPVAVLRTGDGLYYVKRQLLQGILPGAFLFLLFASVDYRRWKSFAIPGLLASLILLVLVFIPGLGVARGGSRSWLNLGGIIFQPSEILKFSFPLYAAAWLSSRRAEDIYHWQRGLLPFLGAVGLVGILLLLQPDTGSMLIIVASALAMYFFSGAPLFWFFGLGALGMSALLFLLKHSPYRAARFMTFLSPELDPLGKGYHINQALLAIGSGGFFGLGFGHSRQKFLYLPEVEADSIIAVMAEELGWIAIVILICLFGALVWRCFKIARESQDPFGSYLAGGIGVVLGLQVVLNIASMTGLMPMTGVTLPFISHGGSAMAILLASMGLLAGIPAAQSTRRAL